MSHVLLLLLLQGLYFVLSIFLELRKLRERGRREEKVGIKKVYCSFQKKSVRSVPVCLAEVPAIKLYFLRSNTVKKLTVRSRRVVLIPRLFERDDHTRLQE
jgi:hypothetical protein